MARSPLRFRTGAEQSKKSDRDSEYGAQDYQQEMVVTSIEPRKWRRFWDALAKFLIAAFLCVETGMVYWFFHDVVISGFLGVGVLWFLVDSRVLWKERSYTPRQMRAFMWVWNGAGVLAMYWNWASASLIKIH
jgi:hypothetical protein